MPRWFNSTCFTSELEQGSMAVLELSHCSLTSVPSDIFKSKEGKLLEEVYLDANQLRDLPRALFSLQNLQVLNLSDNELTIIPSAIANLVNLRQVNFSKNGIIDLPENIKNCKNLQEIDASVNPIGNLISLYSRREIKRLDNTNKRTFDHQTTFEFKDVNFNVDFFRLTD